MGTFAYKARMANGQEISGTVDAKTPGEAMMILRRRQLTPLKVSPAISLGKRNPSMRELAAFTGQLVSFASAGIDLPEAITATAMQFKPHFRDVLLEVARNVSAGMTLSAAMRKHPKVFGELLTGLVAAGEATGTFVPALQHATRYLKKQHSMTSKIKRALTYPVFSLIVAVVIAYGLMVFIVPQFAQMLTDVGGRLPLITTVLLALSSFMRSNSLWILLAAAALYYAFNRWRTGSGKPVWDRLLLKMPIVGPIVRLQILQQLTRLWPLLARSSANHDTALEKIAHSIANVHYQNALLEIARMIQRGHDLPDAFARHPTFFPVSLVAYIRAGSDSGRLADTLEEAADFVEEDLDARIESLQSVLEPIMMVVIGVIVMTIIMGVLLPFLQIAAQIK